MNVTISRNSFGDAVVYHGNRYLGMAMQETDGVWCAVTASAPSSQLPCEDEQHALRTVLMLIHAELEARRK